MRLDAGEFDGPLAECFYPVGERAVEFACIEPDPAYFESEVTAWPND